MGDMWLSDDELRHPLDAAELEELSAFLSSADCPCQSLPLDRLDGYLTAIALLPNQIPPEQWFFHLWETAYDDKLEFQSMAQAMHISALIVRHYNSLVDQLRQGKRYTALFETVKRRTTGKQYLLAEMWAHGFLTGLLQFEDDWRPFLDAKHQSDHLLRPIRLLGTVLTQEEKQLVSTQQQREVLAKQIPAAVLLMSQFWARYEDEGLADT